MAWFLLIAPFVGIGKQTMRKLNPLYYLDKAKDITFDDVRSIAPAGIAFLYFSIRRPERADTWVISERKGEARDNGYAFFRYLRSVHPEQPCVYCIKKRSRDYAKVEKLGDVVEFGGIRHWLLYFTGRYYVSTQVNAPSAAIGVLLERSGLYRPRRVFLQHGVTVNNAGYLHADKNPSICLFTTAANQEREYILREFGYPESVPKLTGFARFDNLHHVEAKNKRVLVMPTWRKWLSHKSDAVDEFSGEFTESEYYLRWRELLASERFKSIVNKLDLEVLFYPHPNMRGLIDVNDFCGSAMRCVSDDEDLQEIIRSAQLLITDYSSVFFDMAYMKRPVIFYQFDEGSFRKYHYSSGWFNYRTSAFGRHCVDAEEVIDSIESLTSCDFEVAGSSSKEHSMTFGVYDDCNCERIFQEIKSLERGELDCR